MAGQGNRFVVTLDATMPLPLTAAAGQKKQDGLRPLKQREVPREPFIQHERLHHPRKNRPLPPWKLTGELR
jgi:hypothetical protein